MSNREDQDLQKNNYHGEGDRQYGVSALQNGNRLASFTAVDEVNEPARADDHDVEDRRSTGYDAERPSFQDTNRHKHYNAHNAVSNMVSDAPDISKTPAGEPGPEGQTHDGEGAADKAAKDDFPDWQPDDTLPFFGISADVLADLTDKRNMELLEKRFGGIPELAEMLYCNPQKGISADLDEQRLQRLPELPHIKPPKGKKLIKGPFSMRSNLFGLNEMPRPKSKMLIRIFFESLNEMILIILMGFAVLSIILELAFPDTPEERAYGWVEGAAILLAVFIVASVTSINDWSKERKFQALSRKSSDIDIKTIRENGQATMVKISQLCCGDVVILEVGDAIPADGLLLEGYDLKIDESAMTGETDLISKSLDKDPFLLSGCKVQEGVGRMLITAVGLNSQWGKTLKLLQQNSDDTQTPLEQKLDKLAKQVGYIGMFFGALIFLVLFFGWLVRKFVMLGKGVPAYKAFEVSDFVEVVRFILVGVTIVVVAVPEGLPLAVTIALAYSVSKMMKDNNLVRQLAACETMGGCTNICSDKTGTLTLNQMRVKKGFIGGKFFDEKLPRTRAKQKEMAPSVEDSVANVISESIAINSNANIVKLADTKKWDVQGNKTESALLILIASKFGADYQTIRAQAKDRIEKMYTFSSLKKRMSVLVRNEEGNGFKLHTKGASEIILDLCSSFVEEDGSVQPISEIKRRYLSDVIVKMASQGLRTISIACRDVPMHYTRSDWEDQELMENDMTLLCIVGIKDPLRKEVPEAVAQCRRSGIMVRMVTGDNILTAQHIARECGILHGDGVAVEGPVFRNLSVQEKLAILPKLQVMARSSPQDKYDLVSLIQSSKKDVVAVTGDGTNDAPALKKADVGLAMGISGTQVAKEASDIIILDDNFESIVKAVLWGRSIYENIRKFLTFQLTVNFVALFLTTVTATTTYWITPYVNADEDGIPAKVKYHPPLAPIQMLWINLIMDTLAALALATEPPIKSLLNRMPYRRTESLITWKMWFQLLSGALYQLAVLFYIFYGGTATLDYFYAYYMDIDTYSTDGSIFVDSINRTWAFHTFVLLQIVNEFNSRKIEAELNIFSNIYKSPLYIVVVIITLVIQTVLVVIPNNVVFQTQLLSWPHWLMGAAFALLILPYMFVIKCIMLVIIKCQERKRKKVEMEEALLDKENGEEGDAPEP